MDKMLKGKKVLFFGIETLGYEKKILDKMREEGAEVDFYSERPVSNTFGKIIVKFCPGLLIRQTEKYYSYIIDQNRGKQYDIILIIKCDTPTRKTLIDLKNAFPEAQLRLYLWDALVNIIGIEEKIDLFDRVTSFDRQDCLEHPEFGFRPLFFADDFKNHVKTIKKYDMSFCGTIHSDRYPILENLRKQCNEQGLCFFGFYYFQSILAYYYYKVTQKQYKKIKKREFHFKSIRTEDVNKIFQESIAIVDIQHPKQVGLTMRTIEAVGAGKKLITTNADIINYDFYRKENICIIDRENPTIPIDFFSTEYSRIPETIIEKYTLKQWVEDILLM